MKLKAAVLHACALAIATSFVAQQGFAFVSKRATEAKLKFSHRVEIVSARKPSKEKQEAQVEAQIQHLFGPLERGKPMAAPKEDHKIKITDVVKKDEEKNVWEIHYDYKGTAVVETRRGRLNNTLELTLPINPDLIYEQAQGGKAKNHCTDEHYQDEGDFWYFWGPKPLYPNCPLEENVHYEVVKGDLDRKPVTEKSFPEYHRMADEDGLIQIHAFFGMDETDKSHNPLRSADINAKAYRDMRESLTSEEKDGLGFEIRKLEPEEIRKIIPRMAEKDMPWVEEASKTYKNGKTIKVRLFFGETGIDEKSKAFHFFLRDALENSAMMIYDGHSGLGGHLDLEAIATARKWDKVQLNKKKYQIYFFNSCTSYTYYNALFFQKKASKKRSKVDPKGTKNLDILANGLATEFDVMHDTSMRLIRAVHNYARANNWTSYQRLAADIDSDNLFTVNGDEDNPEEPVE